MLEALTREFSRKLSALVFDFDGVVYNPVSYAWESHSMYLSRYVRPGQRNLFLGMNPGPFGMVQTGVPFGAIPLVRDYLKITAPVSKPPVEHPGRPVQGFSCTRTEVSGLRFWSFVQQEFPDPDDFFADNCVMNYCPLAFLDSGKTAKNITPDKLPQKEQQALTALCDDYLRQVVSAIGCTCLIGIGQFAFQKLQSIAPAGTKVTKILHPSPASPAANRGWAEAAASQLRAAGVEL